MADTIDEIKVEVSYETKFYDGTEITDYAAVAYAEGFEEPNVTDPTECTKDIVRAWSYICGKGLWRGLQGFFGRTVQSIKDAGVLDDNGKVNWDKLNELNNK